MKDTDRRVLNVLRQSRVRLEHKEIARVLAIPRTSVLNALVRLNLKGLVKAMTVPSREKVYWEPSRKLFPTHSQSSQKVPNL